MQRHEIRRALAAKFLDEWFNLDPRKKAKALITLRVMLEESMSPSALAAAEAMKKGATTLEAFIDGQRIDLSGEEGYRRMANAFLDWSSAHSSMAYGCAGMDRTDAGWTVFHAWVRSWVNDTFFGEDKLIDSGVSRIVDIIRHQLLVERSDVIARSL